MNCFLSAVYSFIRISASLWRMSTWSGDDLFCSWIGPVHLQLPFNKLSVGRHLHAKYHRSPLSPCQKVFMQPNITVHKAANTLTPNQAQTANPYVTFHPKICYSPRKSFFLSFFWGFVNPIVRFFPIKPILFSHQN